MELRGFGGTRDVLEVCTESGGRGGDGHSCLRCESKPYRRGLDITFKSLEKEEEKEDEDESDLCRGWGTRWKVS